MSIKKATIHLGYFKQGDDLSGCLVKNNHNGSVNTKKTIEKHIYLLESVISHLKQINDKIPEINNCIIDGDTHYISIEGDEEIINDLISNELAHLVEDYEEDYCQESNNDLSESNDNNEEENIDHESNINFEL